MVKANSKLLGDYLSLSASGFKPLFYDGGENNKESGMLTFIG